MSSNLPIIIVGAGIVGLTLAQALKKSKIPFLIFERDTSLSQSSGGWAITVHWALPAFQSCLLTHLFERLKDIQVDPQQGIEDTGRFLFLDLLTAEPKFIIPPSKRLRIDRRKLRALLSEGVDIQWRKNFISFAEMTNSIVAQFEDGTRVEGSLLIGADGSSSRTRRLMYASSPDPSMGLLNQLPVRFMGITLKMSPEQVEPLRDIDPLLFQGSHPNTGVYLWYSILSTPEVNGSAGGNEFYEAQLMLSWLYRSAEDEVPSTHFERLTKMKSMAQDFEPRLRNAINSIPEGSEVLEIRLQDWPPQAWNNCDGRITLVGDAAHAMTMFRGEAFNHGITDAAELSQRIIEAHTGAYDAESFKNAVQVYETEMRERTYSAVLLSRQACLDAHDLRNLGPESPLVSKRARVLEPGRSAS
ncbi:FAD-binding domain-containing protein [Zopfia rhizophila CBS 207.26]|uniref:FAD-binding domain-containing protein n=1 Tax=Zopfia rhizophila CBS 207.26 TaxID=1314779 RepID=A0A6A6DJA9_9PEZI|nr:FAD-binding domain-containing protein [Zopfia rhizophila CBS 207.26]